MDNFLRQTAAGPADTVTDSDSAVPPHADGYHTGRLLGVGGSAAVWLVTDARTGEARALKVPKASPNGVADLRQLRREVTVLAGLTHPHLLAIHDVVATDLGPALLMDYAAGGSVLNLVTVRRRLSVGECVTVLVPLARALAFLHSRSVVHGDVAPGNVLLTPEGMPLLSDLGTGRLIAEAESVERFTDGFAAGEVIQGHPPDPRSDVYSVAALGWYVLTGQAPGQARHRAPLTVLVPEVSPELRDILEAGLDEDPRRRPTASDLAQAVLSAAEAQPLDLVNAVHPTVLPHLLTRRATRDQQTDGHRKLSATLGGIKVLARRRKAQGRRAHVAHGTGGAGGQRLQRMVRPAVAAGLVVSGTFLVLPQLPGAAETSPGPADLNDRSASENADSTDTTQIHTARTNTQLSEAVLDRLDNGDPLKALPALATVRARAFATGDPGLLSHVNVDGSDAMAADREILGTLAEQGHVYQGLSVRLESMSLLEENTMAEGAADDKAAVRATAQMSGYTEADTSGQVVQNVPEPAPQELLFLLERVNGTWKIGQVHTPDGV
ncbi:protein kinase [Arthrobacter sp. JZ12]|uniref:serine/threonine protein kinase n=1 Tax=Arthrobacter sp. JZ12 TaxID=2654190 RepID=UPI002B47BE3A|nr:serine/threonine-protein kinase [Arthrobacter sp. JZ12]WRH24754.1 protein kinase [Arthrobacter sp. JZ12]